VRRPLTLTSRLVVTAVALVVVASLLIGGATALAMRSYLTDRLDQGVTASLERAQFGFGGDPGGDVDRPLGPPPGDGDGDEDDVRGQQVGTLTAFLGDAGPGEGGFVITDAGRGRTSRTTLDSDVVAAVAALPADGRVHAVDLPGLGSYRVAVSGGIAAGLPDAEVTDAVTALVEREVLLILLGAVLAALAGRAVVRRQLRPLREVAATAHTVADLPLAAGTVDLADRVPAHLVDERTEVGQVGAALDTLLDHVESSLEARHRSEQRVRQFVADASHELRTPLTTIAGYTELARRRPDDPAAAATALAKVSQESARMTALVEDLLLLARLDSGRPLERRPVDLTSLLLGAVADAEVVGPDHTWRLDLPDEALEVTGDEQRLHQVVTNLLTNARKYTPAGSTVTVTGRPDGFSVHDDGPGFPPTLVDHAFERFARGDSARERSGGVGLGLALVEAIVTAHGGTVSLASRPGDTRVDVRLARGRPEA